MSLPEAAEKYFRLRCLQCKMPLMFRGAQHPFMELSDAVHALSQADAVIELIAAADEPQMKGDG